MAPRVVKERKWAYGWHWRNELGSLKNGDPRVPAVGQRLVARHKNGHAVRNPRWCKAGFHAAPSLHDSYNYKEYGSLLSFVLMEDCQFYGRDKFTARARTILWERIVPDDIRSNMRDRFLKNIEKWLRGVGFNADSMRAKARRLRKKFPNDRKPSRGKGKKKR